MNELDVMNYRRQCDHPLYQVWRGMIRRCFDPKVKNYKNYGGRGITVCDRWRNFRQFICDMPPRPSRKHTIDRRDNNGNYEYDNVGWATKREQARNMRHNRWITINGETRIAEDWLAEFNLPKNTLFNRLGRGWSDERSVTASVKFKAADHTVFPPGGYVLCKQRGVNPETVKSRLRRGWSFERALSAPIKHEHAKHKHV